MHILLVEDTLIAQIATKILLVKAGCTVDTAIDGASAVEQALHKKYDVILMDIGLGDGPDGFDVSTSIKQQSEMNKTTPIIALTAHNESEYIEKAKSQGMQGYLTKPFTVEDAKNIVNYLTHPTASFIMRGLL